MARTFNVKSILPNDYNKLTLSNFFLSNARMRLSATSGSGLVSNNILASYNASTGILSCNASYAKEDVDILWIEYTVVAVY